MRDFSKMTEGEALFSIGVRPAVRDGKKGILFPSPDPTAKPLFIEASDEKPDCIIASENKRDRVKGARKTMCYYCRRKAWISPSTQAMLKRYPKTPVICLKCFIKRTEKEKKENGTDGTES